jgi:L-aspartate oxidase
MYDVIITGSGIAGLYTALCLDEKLSVLMLSKAGLSQNNSSLAQGGVAAVIDPLDDDFSLHVNDTLVAGGYRNNIPQVERLVEHGPEDIQNLIKLGVQFDRNADGKLNLTLEGGHSRRRIAHCKDHTGAEVTNVLLERVFERKNITLLENASALSLKKHHGVFDMLVYKDGVYQTYHGKRCILATGGIGSIYKYSTNPPIACGDGIRFAYENGAVIKHISYIQFHPTAFAGGSEGQRFLVSEAVRGEGGLLLNVNGRRFMPDYEPERKELAPRDVVAGCMMKEQAKTGSDKFYIDITGKDGDFVRERFPTIYGKLLEYGFDMTKDPIPVYPCHHYLMGGVDVDKFGRTACAGLYAAGECAHTGVHGSNRLASNSLLEALVFSRFVAKDINECHIESVNCRSDDTFEVPAPADGMPDFEKIKQDIREIMTGAYFVNADMDKARAGYEKINAYYDSVKQYPLVPDCAETLSMLTTAGLILREIVVK